MFCEYHWTNLIWIFSPINFPLFNKIGHLLNSKWFSIFLSQLETEEFNFNFLLVSFQTGFCPEQANTPEWSWSSRRRSPKRRRSRCKKSKNFSSWKKSFTRRRKIPEKSFLEELQRGFLLTCFKVDQTVGIFDWLVSFDFLGFFVSKKTIHIIGWNIAFDLFDCLGHGRILYSAADNFF